MFLQCVIRCSLTWEAWCLTFCPATVLLLPFHDPSWCLGKGLAWSWAIWQWNLPLLVALYLPFLCGGSTWTNCQPTRSIHRVPTHQIINTLNTCTTYSNTHSWHKKNGCNPCMLALLTFSLYKEGDPSDLWPSALEGCLILVLASLCRPLYIFCHSLASWRLVGPGIPCNFFAV